MPVYSSVLYHPTTELSSMNPKDPYEILVSYNYEEGCAECVLTIEALSVLYQGHTTNSAASMFRDDLVTVHTLQQFFNIQIVCNNQKYQFNFVPKNELLQLTNLSALAVAKVIDMVIDKCAKVDWKLSNV